MRTKICGIRNWEDARICIEAGVDAIGFLVGITHLAEDKIEPVEAKKIIKKLPPFISSVMVTHLTDVDEIVNLANHLDVTTVQIHDYLEPQKVNQVRNRLPKCKIIKAVHIIEEKEALKMMDSFQGVCDALLLDSRTKDRLGGTGKTHDWNISKKIVSMSNIPVILAGGLNEKNVYDAIIKTMPFGVDVNSGVEVDGWKDKSKVKKFIADAQSAFNYI